MTSRLIVALALTPAVFGSAAFNYRQAVPGYQYRFPRDHFEHPDFRTEWWYYTGNVFDTAGKRFGFELVFFRQGERGGGESGASAWSVQDLYLAHAALTDVSGKRFSYDQRLNRRGPGIADASFRAQRIWNGNWQVKWSGQDQILDAVTSDFRFHLTLRPVKPAVIEGVNGISQKAEARGRASYYVSFPRLAATGTIESAGTKHVVQGAAWMDHEWFTQQLAPDEAGWDWFSIQLDNNTELMLYQLRHKDNSLSRYSSGTFIDAKATAHYLTSSDFSLEPLEREGKYPIRWRIRIPSLGIDLSCTPVMPNQELRARKGGPSYWEGAVNYSGTQHGVGYLEMTGYDAPVQL